MRLPMRPDPQPRPLVSRGVSAPSPLGELLQGLAVQRRVIVAIVLREVRTRFGQYHLGYLWAVFVPLLFIVTLAFVHAALGRQAAHGTSVEVLLLSGMMAWLTFTDTQNQTSRAYQTNRQLVVYPMVSVVDIVIARALLELGTKFGVMTILIALFWAAGFDVGIADPLGVVAAMLTVAYLGAMFGHTIGCVLVVAPSFLFIVATSRRVLFFTSGVLFLLSDIPAEWRTYILYNPLAHVIDLTRGAWISSYSAPYGEVGYVASWAVGLTATAAVGELVARRRRLGANR
jgi:capsular polysaccharide transport system permease protein